MVAQALPLIMLAEAMGMSIPIVTEYYKSKGIDLSGYDANDIVPLEVLLPEQAHMKELKSQRDWSQSYYKPKPVVEDTALSEIIVQSDQDDDEVIEVKEEDLEKLPRKDVGLPDPDQDPNGWLKELANISLDVILRELENKAERWSQEQLVKMAKEYKKRTKLTTKHVGEGYYESTIDGKTFGISNQNIYKEHSYDFWNITFEDKNIDTVNTLKEAKAYIEDIHGEYTHTVIEEEIQKDDDIPDPRQIGTTGQYVGLPPGIDTPEKLKDFRDKAYQLFDSGKYGRYWYKDSADTILNSVQGDVVEADKIAQLIGLFSAGSPVGTDVTYAMQAYNAYKNGEDIFTGRFPTAQSEKAKTILEGGTWEGRKTNNFYKAIAREFNPELTNDPVVDIWMMRAFGFEDFEGTPTDAQYKSVGNEIKRIANQIIKENPTWNMNQVQASLWVAMKAQKVGEEKAKFNYKDAIQNNLAQLSWETAPGDTTGHLEGFDKLPYNDKVEYHVEASKIALDEKGEDILAKYFGILSPNEFEAPGHFKGEVNPSTQKEIIAPQKYKDGKQLDPNIVKMINSYAASKGLIYNQNSIAWHRPFWTDIKKKGDGIHITIGDRSASVEETKKISALANEYASEMWGLPVNDFNFIGTKDGGRFLNVALKENEQGEFVPIFTNKQFQEIIFRATDEVFANSAVNVDLKFFANNGNYIENDWSKNINGETFLETVRKNTPDLYQGFFNILTTIIAKRIQLDETFAKEKNLTINEQISKDLTLKKREGGIVEIPHFHYGGFINPNRL